MDEVFFGEIKEIFVMKYGISLIDMIDGECSGDYRKMLMALMNDSQ